MNRSAKDGLMREFVAERALPGAGELTEEEIQEITDRALAANESLEGEAKWLHSYFTDDKAFCVFRAKDPESIFRHGEAVGVPVDKVSAVRQLLASDD